MKHDEKALQRAALFTGVSLTVEQLDSLSAYGEWLIAEAIPAGGLGPAEAERIVDRHLADSLVFAQWDLAPQTLLDLGSGVGLPGIPLAIAHPRVSVTLLDRSQRRTDLAKRAVRILGLDVAVVCEPWEAHRARYDVVTVRAALGAEPAVDASLQLLGRGGVAVIGLSRGSRPPTLSEPPGGVVVELLETPDGVLDSPAWHLRMTVR